MNTSSSPKKVSCPTCKKETIWSPDNRFRPFCSERCKMIDLGQWANESYRVPVIEQDEFDNPPSLQ
ncbi:DNA gyrase inhibitor YacG [Leeia oryzae]|uniref:DNA gyrase inhibitor YacG n=1 Tax=Leeia oryzae TaxID=356662 RepID=UPI00036E675A|nr:DNA gyrase inhibitor YacG [Leeia oryzae]